VLTSKALRELVEPVLKNGVNVNRKLEKILKHPVVFRMMLQQTEAVVSGEFARSFFLGRESPNVLHVGVAGEFTSAVWRT
jgi:hypothetical protein